MMLANLKDFVPAQRPSVHSWRCSCRRATIHGHSWRSKLRPLRRPPAAKRLSKEEAAAGEWAVLLHEQGTEPEEGGITVGEVNELCNRGLKLMLSDNARELQNFRDELNVVGKAFTDHGNIQAGIFIYVLYMMSEHVIVDQTAKLTGMYEEAFTRVFSLLEDSGWKLLREGEAEDEDSNNFDDLPSLGYMPQL